MIRPATLDDLTGLVARGKLHHEELGFPWSYDEISTAKAVAALIDRDTLLVDDHLSGYIGWEMGPIYFNNDVLIATEHFWYVVPSHRSTGLGSELLRAAQAQAQLQGASWFSVQLPPQSEAAIELVDQHNFQQLHGVYGVSLWPDQ